MKFLKKIKIKDKIIEIKLNNLKYKKENIFIFGSPFGLNLDKINEKNILDSIKNVSGFFFLLIIKKKKLFLLQIQFQILEFIITFQIIKFLYLII